MWIEIRTVSCTATGTGQNFIIGCWYFFKKTQVVSNYRYESKTLSSLPVLFLLLSFCYLVTFSSLVFVLYISCWFNTFLFFVLYGVWGLLLWLESKKKGERKSVNTDGSSVWKVQDWRFGKVSNYCYNGPCSNPTWGKINANGMLSLLYGYYFCEIVFCRRCIDRPGPVSNLWEY